MPQNSPVFSTDCGSQAERKPRKSVQFDDSTIIVDSDGQATEGGPTNGEKDSAESHAPGMRPHHTNTGDTEADLRGTADEKEVDELTDMFAGLAKKVRPLGKFRAIPLTTRQKKKKPKTEGEDAEDVLSGLKKKKKSKKPKAETDDFDAQLAAVAGDADEKEAPAEDEVEEGDMMKGTGIWQHDSTAAVPYNMLLNRFFTLLHSQHPDLASSGAKSYKIPPPQCLREGNKKTIFANISEICKRMKRTDEHGTYSPII